MSRKTQNLPGVAGTEISGPLLVRMGKPNFLASLDFHSFFYLNETFHFLNLRFTSVEILNLVLSVFDQVKCIENHYFSFSGVGWTNDKYLSFVFFVQ